MLKVISLALLLAQTLFPAAPPGVGESDAYARAAGNDKPMAILVGTRVFRTQWPAQLLSVYADLVDDSDVIGLRISGKHFHGVLHFSTLSNEVADLTTQAFAADQRVEEVDVWVTVPLDLGKDLVVKSDVNTPTWKTVFTISVRRGESRQAILARIQKGTGIYWDQEWKHTVLK